MSQFMQSIGIDVSKAKLDVCFLYIQEARIKTFENTPEGISKLIETITTPQTPIIIEATGDFHLLASCMLKEAGLSVFVINPLITKKLTNATIRGSKSDKADAKLLAKLAITHQEELVEYHDDRDSIILKKELKSLRNTVLKLREARKSLKQLGETTIALKGSANDMITELETDIVKLEKAIKNIEHNLLKRYDRKLATELAKISGVSTKAAKLITIHLEGKVFDDASKLVAFTGFDVRRRQSGTSINTKGCLSKRGSSFLRDILFKTAWGLKMHNEKFRDIFEKARSKGKHYYTCLNIIVRKLLRIVYGLMKSGGQLDQNLF